MKEMITNRNVEFGTTPNGRDWCVKALHPSDPLTDVHGIPDESSVPSLFMNYQSVYTVGPAAGATGTWFMDGQLIPNPLSFGACAIHDSVGGRFLEFVNTQVEGADHYARLASFLGQFARWRLAYAAVTIYQDGPDLANQGTVVVCQKPVDPARYNVAVLGSTATGSYGMHHAFHMEAADLPDFNRSQAMPNSYFGKSREGAYIPLKLTRTHQTWHSHRDLTLQATSATMTSYDTPVGGKLHLSSNTSDESTGLYPFLSMNDCHQYIDTGGSAYVEGSLTSDFCNENWADFSFRNMAVTTSLSMFFRFGFEVQVPPTSNMAPHLHLSPQCDEQAIRAYFAISRELKDAYPAEYNDLGKIWNVISSVAKAIAPALSFIPGVGPLLSAGVTMGANAGDRLKSAIQRVRNPTQGSTASASDIELVKDAKTRITQSDIKAAKKRIANRVTPKRK